MRTVDNPAVGVVYRVKLDDCCIKGEFTAKLIERRVPDWWDSADGECDEWSMTWVFDNGVTLTEHAVELETIELSLA